MDILKRYVGGTTPWSEFYPKTVGTSVFGNSTNSSLALLNGSDKINTAFIPDYILGQTINGGTLGTTSDGATVTLTANGKSKLGITGSATSITLVNTATGTHTSAGGSYGYQDCDSLYFICASSITFAGLDIQIGDWLVSNATSWVKIDNTDAVTGVNGRTGAVTLTLGTNGNNLRIASSGTEGTTYGTDITVPFATNSTTSTYSGILNAVPSGSTPSTVAGKICFLLNGNKFVNGGSDITLGNSISGNAATATTATSAGTCTGNSATATKLNSARTFALTGDVTGSVSSDLTSEISIATTVVDDSHNHHGSTVLYNGVTIASRYSSQNIITSGQNLNVALSGSINNLFANSAKIYYGSDDPTGTTIQETPHVNDLWLCTA